MATNAEQEIRQEFERWFEESAEKDIDGVMSHIADDVLSDEHDAPLQYVGAHGVREVCQAGFDAMEGRFRCAESAVQSHRRGADGKSWIAICQFTSTRVTWRPLSNVTMTDFAEKRRR